MNRSAISFSQAQRAYDAQTPDYETDAEQALREWVEKCPVAISEWVAGRITDIVQIEARDGGAA